MVCSRHIVAVLLLLRLSSLHCVTALDNGLSQKPPLGFNTWNYFGCDVNERVVRAAADRMVELGLVAAGYTYINIDDCWQAQQRDSQGRLQPDPVKFPSGMSALADYVHQRGMKFGIYSDAGSNTCAGYPGSRHHEEVDAQTFASWGVDFLKYDNCYAEDRDLKERYSDMRDALNKTGRPIYFSMCNWGRLEPWEWAHSVGNSWRTYEDIFPNWPSMLRSLDYGAAGLGQYARPGGWNDPDMLEVGVARWSLAQQRSHFALWALVKSPLLIGANLELVGQDSLDILKAPELIQVNQDELGVAGDIIRKDGSSEVWAAPLSGDARAVVLFNRHATWLPQLIRVTWAQLGYTNEAQQGSGFKAHVRDLYAQKDLGVFADGFEARVASSDVMAIKVTPLRDDAAPVSEAQQLSVTWRPWSDPSAAALQARMREDAKSARAWAAWRSRWVNFVLAHRYAAACAAAAVLGAAVVAIAQCWMARRQRLARSASASSSWSSMGRGGVQYMRVDSREGSSGGAATGKGFDVLCVQQGGAGGAV